MAGAEPYSIIRRNRVAASPDFVRVRDALARNVRTLRTAHRLSQFTLAAEAGITQAAVSMIEAGKANPTMHSLERIARVFGLDVAALLAEPARKS